MKYVVVHEKDRFRTTDAGRWKMAMKRKGRILDEDCN